MKHKNILLLIIIFFFFSCSDSGKKIDLKKGESIEISKSGDSILVKKNNKGILLSKKVIDGGKLNGLSKTFYPNGKVKFEDFYKNDLKNGMSKWYFENGVLYQETPYENGKINGWQKVYYPSGDLMAEIPYQKGDVIIGTKEYTKDGDLVTDYPTVRYFLDDTRAANGGDYMLKVLFTDEGLDGFFYYYTKEKNGDSSKVGIPVRSNRIAYIIYNPRVGDQVPEKLMLYGEFKSKLGNPVVTKTLYVAQ